MRPEGPDQGKASPANQQTSDDSGPVRSRAPTEEEEESPGEGLILARFSQLVRSDQAPREGRRPESIRERD